MGLFVLEQSSLGRSLSAVLAAKLTAAGVDEGELADVFLQTLAVSPDLLQAVARDLVAASDRDPAAHGVANVFLHHKGFQALQAYRLAHALWLGQRRCLSLFLQSRVSEVFAVDIHPAARIGSGVFIDHGTGVVVGETAVVEDDVSLLQEVTLGGTGKESGDRHPKVGKGVLVCAGAKVLGNIRIGEGSKIGAGSVVLSDVAPHTTVVGVPARPVGTPRVDSPALMMDQRIEGDRAWAEDGQRPLAGTQSATAEPAVPLSEAEC
ncbi:serine acetyltransferase [Caldimonas brevitalea]|uniref:Serine acetyltransferase n=2 Tax=Caldimonas brevitalea TaxID=413882 RepID=A0A0G3BNE0_9BURK|nr:serine acetyltransferase [Caldimonas brevitalea]